MRRRIVVGLLTMSPLALAVMWSCGGAIVPSGDSDRGVDTTVDASALIDARASDALVSDGQTTVDPDDRDVLFYPTSASAEAKEIGVINDYVYWWFDLGLPTKAGIAGSDLASGASFTEIVAPDQSIRMVDIGHHVVFQTIDNTLRVILAGSTKPGSSITLGGAPNCLALASDAQNVYCRAALNGGSAIYAWPATAGGASAPSIVHMLPPGNGLGVDAQHFYFSEDSSLDVGSPKASVLSVARDADVAGAKPTFTTLASRQAAPFGMAVGPSYVAWFDSLRDGTFAARSASKLEQPPTADSAAAGFSIAATRTGLHVAADPITNDYWVGVGNDESGAWSIHKIAAGTSNTTLFRSGTSADKRGFGVIGGLAVDATYVYWTRSNGRVYRALKNGPKP